MKLPVIFGFVATIILTLLGSFYTVDEGDRGVVVSMGVVTGTAEPGIHFKLPFVTSVHTIPVRNQIKSYEGLEAYTTDQQIATIEGINIGYRIPADQVENVYREYRTPEAVVDRFVGRRVNAELEKVFGQYSAERTVKERAALAADVAKALKDIPQGAPIEILSVELASIAYPADYTQRINARMGAEVEVAKKIQEVRQAEQDRLKSQQEADARAYAITVQAKAEADAIKLKGEALRASPELVELTKAERWNGVLPTSMVPGTAVPFLSIK